MKHLSIINKIKYLIFCIQKYYLLHRILFTICTIGLYVGLILNNPVIVLLSILVGLYFLINIFIFNMFNRDWLYSNLSKLKSISHVEKKDLFLKLKNEYKMSLIVNSDVIIDKLPTYIKIEELVLNERLTEMKIKNISHNEKIMNIFNDLPKIEQKLINLNEFLVDEDNQDIDILKYRKNYFGNKIKEVRQDLLFI